MRNAFRQALPEAAERFGTPLYAYDWQTIATRVEHVRQAFTSPEHTTRVFYAMKANPNLNLLRRLYGLGLGVEVVSSGELERADRIGGRSWNTRPDIVFNGPGKLDADLTRAHEFGAVIVIDALGEIERCAQFARSSRVLLRINPGLQVSTHDHLATGNANSKFGLRLEDVEKAVQAAERSRLEVIGLHMHIGSSITDPNDYALAFERLTALAPVIGHRPVFDMGGGFGLTLELAPLAKAAFATARAFGASELWLEPGRYLVAPAGVLLTRVLELKETARKYAVLDAGMTELLRPMLYGATHPVARLEQNHPEHGRDVASWDLAGPACESGDVLARDVALGELRRGELLGILEAGAYGASMASSYLTRPRPAEVLFEDDAWTVLRRHETFSEMLAAEVCV